MKFDMQTEPLPPGRPKNWLKHTVIIACTAIFCIFIVILYVRLENITREESSRRYEQGLRVVKGTCGGLLEGNNGSLNFVIEPKLEGADTWSSSCLWIIHLYNETNIRFTLTALSEDAFLNLCSGDELASCSTSSYTKRLNSTHVGSSFEFLGKTLIVVLPSSSASVGFSWHFVKRERMQATDLTNLKAKWTAAVGDGVETLTEEMHNLTVSQGIVEGIIAGTTNGLVIIPLDSLKQRKFSYTSSCGVAFNWRSRKVYWVEHKAGIITANLDRSSAKIVVAESTAEFCGLAVDQVTGNFYYVVRGLWARIRVCDSTGKKCRTLVSGVNYNDGISNYYNVGYIDDIAVFPSEGLMFWSSRSHNGGKSVTRANMNGTNSTKIISEDISGLFLHELEEKLYWANFSGQSIGNHDLNGHSRNVLLNTTMYPFDIAVNGDTMYVGGASPNGVYSVTSDQKVSTIAKTAGYVNHIALYGRKNMSSLQNPCHNSPCVSLCVLTRVSYSCL